MEKTDKKERRTPIWRRMREEYDRATLRCCRVEAMGACRIVVQGCRDILEYGQETICLAVDDPDICRLIVHGCGLVCLSYHLDAVIIEGDIRTIDFAHGKGE